METTIVSLNNYIDLVYSPDDGGWYLHKVFADQTSQVFQTESDARAAFDDDSAVEWSG